MSIAGWEVTRRRTVTLFHQLNGRYHGPALWIYMIIIVAHWLEHVLQIYQIYALGWLPAQAGGLLGVIFPKLVESEVLHFVYDFIQWAGIVVLRPGFMRHARALAYWTAAMVVQTWHFFEHILLISQYVSGRFLFGAARQISIGQLWFPRAELHFFYNLFVFVPMVIAVHYYLKPKLALIETSNTTSSNPKQDHELNIKTMQRTEQLAEDNNDDEREDVPFGADGVQFLRNLLQFGVFLGIWMLLLIVVRWFNAQ